MEQIISNKYILNIERLSNINELSYLYCRIIKTLTFYSLSADSVRSNIAF